MRVQGLKYAHSASADGDNDKSVSRRMRRRVITRNQKGATAVEFAIILPVLILVLFGIIEFSLVLFNKHIITNASREGARAGIVARPERFQENDSVVVSAVVNNWLAGHLVTFGNPTPESDRVKVEIQDEGTPDWYEYEPGVLFPGEDPCVEFECLLRVTVTYNYDFLVLSNLGFGPITLIGTTIMRME